MPKFTVHKTKVIDAPAANVWPHIRKFENWRAWSPWLIAEPETEVTYRDDGMGYGWKGKIVGSGKIDLLDEKENEAMDMRLTFLEPWKSENETRFRLEEKDGKTTVSWDMTGSLPFFLFWMKKMMSAWVGMDYDRGLSMLKDISETGSTPSKLDFEGSAPFSGRPYVGVRTACAISDIGPRMEADMGKLHAWLQESGTEATGVPFSIYHKWSPGKGRVEYTSAVPVAKAPDTTPAGMVSGTQPDVTTYRVKHTGPYHHLGNAWSAGMMHGRAKRFKQDKSIHPFEVYESDPTEVAPNELVTVVHFPVK
ncbi:MAG: SRPBCC family protein [Planctomycetota bacterium]|nr:SRPBCC family protein [Planctomycetota bacterium]